MSQPLRLGVAGLGTVGAGLLNLLQEHGERLAQMLGRRIVVDGRLARAAAPRSAAFRSRTPSGSTSPSGWPSTPRIDVFVELIGGEEGVARQSVEAALKAGKHVVTANKALLAYHGPELARLAEKHGVALNFEAAVAGAIPDHQDAARVAGRQSGAARLRHPERHLQLHPDQDAGGAAGSSPTCSTEAQAKGYAEADPTFDIGGFDTAHKLALLTSLAFGTRVAFDQIDVEGIQSITQADIEAADELGYRIKLLGVALQTESGIEQRVHPAMVPKHSAIAEVSGVTNCVAVDGDFAGNVLLAGPGAGARATASAVASDIVDIARGARSYPFGVPAAKLKPYKRAKLGQHQGAYYVRLSVFDRPGAMASIAKRMGDREVSLESVVQRRPRGARPGIDARPKPGLPTPVTLITHETTEEAIRGALDAIHKDRNVVSETPQMIRIEPM